MYEETVMGIGELLGCGVRDLGKNDGGEGGCLA